AAANDGRSASNALAPTSTPVPVAAARPRNCRRSVRWSSWPVDMRIPFVRFAGESLRSAGVDGSTGRTPGRRARGGDVVARRARYWTDDGGQPGACGVDLRRTGSAAMAHENVEVIRRAYQAWNAGAMDALRECY